MSDLHCPATLLISGPGDAEQVIYLVGEVRSRRVAKVYCGTLARAVQSAGLAATELGVLPVVVDGLQELSAGEDPHAVVSRFRDAIESIADLHRGETVLVFTDGAGMALAVPRLSANVRDDLAAQQVLPSCKPAEVDIDSDGWRVVSWPGTEARVQNRREPTSSMPRSAS